MASGRLAMMDGHIHPFWVGQRPGGAAKPAPGTRSFWRWSGCRMQLPSRQSTAG